MSGIGPGSREYDWDNNSDNDTTFNDDNIYGGNAIEDDAYNNGYNAADNDDVHDFENENTDDDYAENDVNGDQYNDDNHDDEEVNDNNDSGSNDDDHEGAIENNEHNDQVQIPDLVPNENFEQEPQPGVNPEQEPAPGAAVAPIHHPVMVVEIQEIQGKDSSQWGVSAK